MGRLCSGLLYCRIRAFQQALGYFGARHYCRSWFHTITTSYRYPNIGNFVKYFALVSTQRERSGDEKGEKRLVYRSVSYSSFDGNVTVDFYPTAEFLMVFQSVNFFKEGSPIDVFHRFNLYDAFGT